MSNFVVSGPQFTGLFSSNAGGIVVDILVFRFWISLSVPEIFAIEVWSCPKSTLILHDFGFQTFWGGRAHKFWDMDYKIEHCSYTWQSFTSIGRGSSEISRWKKEQKTKRKETSAVKHKATGNYRSGNNLYFGRLVWTEIICCHPRAPAAMQLW